MDLYQRKKRTMNLWTDNTGTILIYLFISKWQGDRRFTDAHRYACLQG